MAVVKKSFEMEDLDCANCARKMQDAVSKIEGVISCEISFMAQKMKLEYEEEKEVLDILPDPDEPGEA